jgi:UDP-N-acetyl-D-mannosaminuronic acid transferase (WecB/TagA/CpsF family)
MNSVSRHVLGMRVDAISCKDAAQRVVKWALEGQSAYVCVATVHMVMEAFDSKAFRKVINGAHLVTAQPYTEVFFASSGGVVCVLDSDGYWLPHKVKRTMGRETMENFLEGLEVVAQFFLRNRKLSLRQTAASLGGLSCSSTMIEACVEGPRTERMILSALLRLEQ